MANSFTTDRSNGNLGTTERGKYSVSVFRLALDDAGASAHVNLEVDMVNTGALTIGCYVENANAGAGGSKGVGGIKVTPQISIDGANWTTIAWKDETGSAGSSAEQTIADNTNQYMMINFSSYPEALCARFFRLRARAASTPASVSKPIITIVTK